MNEQRKQERREFNEALRARMRLIAAQRGVADADMKWIGRLKHYHLAEFVRKHQLDWHWVLLGTPEKAPPSLRVIQGGRQ
jgi:hypothetical protein